MGVFEIYSGKRGVSLPPVVGPSPKRGNGGLGTVIVGTLPAIPPPMPAGWHTICHRIGLPGVTVCASGLLTPLTHFEAGVKSTYLDA